MTAPTSEASLPDDTSARCDEDTADGVGEGAQELRGKLRLDRGPLRWWLIVAGLAMVQYAAWRFAAGMGMVALGAALHLISKGYLRPGRKFLLRTGEITTCGPYRFVRNPFYLANLIAEVGLLIVIGRLWLAVLYLPVWAWVYCETILEEERKLRQLCGTLYERYCTQVPRLIPVPWRYRPTAELSGPEFSWSNPHIADGKEIERALRLLSYPLMLRAVAVLHDGGQWPAVLWDAHLLAYAVGFVLLNGLGRLTTPALQRLRRSEGEESPNSAQDSDQPANFGSWAA